MHNQQCVTASEYPKKDTVNLQDIGQDASRGRTYGNSNADCRVKVISNGRCHVEEMKSDLKVVQI